MTERRIQEILDSNTEHIPESLYIQLSNEVMRLHNRPTSFGDEVELLEFQTSLLNVALRDANVRERSLRRQLHDIRHGGELARVKEELEVRKKVNADSVAMYKSQITAQCAKIVEYKSKIRELTEKLKSPVEIPRQVEVPPQQPVEIPRPVEVPPQQPVARPQVVEEALQLDEVFQLEI